MNSCRFNPDIVRICLTFVCLLWLGAVITWAAADHYVVPTNASASSPFTDWGSAATNIQHAVNAAVDGETVWITNGTYFCQEIYTNISGTTTSTAMVVITNSITVSSFNGQYSNTIVNGYYPAWTTRVFLVDNTGAVVSGLTITNGFSTSLSGVGVRMYNGNLLTNCLITGNVLTNDTGSALCAGIHMTSGTISRCIINGNKALGTNSSCSQIAALYCAGGGGTITNCQISWNSIGRGTSYGDTCWLAYGYYRMQDCVVHNNSAYYAIQMGANFVGWCAISNNSSTGVWLGEGSILRNCLIVTNGGYGVGIGRWGGELRNCTIAGHTVRGIEATECAGSSKYSIENNIIYYNVLNWYSTNLFYTNCCTDPLPTLGTNNIANTPLFVNNNAGNWRLSANSPCINRGTNQTWMTNSVDLDGSARIRYGKVDIGAYEHINKGTVYNFQ